MENASKALLIAGAILLAILIIGLGVFIYNQASNTVSETGMDQIAVRQFNAQFEPYIMDNASGVTAMALYDTVNAYNATAESGKKINLLLGGKASKRSVDDELALLKAAKASVAADPDPIPVLVEGIRFQKSELSSTRKYNIYVDEYDGGTIKTIVIEPVSTGVLKPIDEGLLEKR